MVSTPSTVSSERKLTWPSSWSDVSWARLLRSFAAAALSMPQVSPPFWRCPVPKTLSSSV